MQSSTYNPQNVSDFSKSALNKAAKGYSQTCAAGQATNLDVTLTDDMEISGGHVFLAKGANWGDTVDYQIVMGGNVVLQPITSWPVNPDSNVQQLPPSNYPAKLPAGLVMRIVYHSTGVTDVQIQVGYNLEKIMV